MRRTEIENLLQRKGDLHVLLVDDGSTDGTGELITALASSNPRIHVLRLPKNGGKAEAVRQGMLELLNRGFTWIGYSDADFATPVPELVRLWDVALSGNSPVVIGSRIRLLGTNIQRRAYRHYLGRIFATLGSLALGVQVYDTQCGAKVFRANPTLRRALESPFQTRWIFDVELMGRLLSDVEPLTSKDFVEVPLREWVDVGGSKLTTKAMIGAGFNLASVGFDLWVRRLQHPKMYKYRSILVRTLSVVLAALLLKALFLNKEIASRNAAYFPERSVVEAQRAAQLGFYSYEGNDYVSAFQLKPIGPEPYQRGLQQIIRSGPSDPDDLGYSILLQSLALSGLPITKGFVEGLHNFFFLGGLGLLGLTIGYFYRNVLAGLLVIVMGLLFQFQIRSLIYGSLDNRFLANCFPLFLLSLMFVIPVWFKRVRGMSRWGIIAFLGFVVALMRLTRSSEGMLALMGVMALVVFLPGRWWQRAMRAVVFYACVHLSFVAIPNLTAVQRDVKNGMFEWNLEPYTRIPGGHASWHSLLIGIGRYSNPLNLKYDDVSGYEYVRSVYPKNPEVVDPVRNIQGPLYFEACRDLYFKYIMTYPLDFATYTVRAMFENFLMIPYATNLGNWTWQYGYLPKKESLRFKHYDAIPNELGLANVRVSYLPWQKQGFMLIYILSLAVYYMLIRKIVRDVRNRDFSSAIFWAPAFAYLGAQWVARALVPVHGTSLIVSYWMISILIFVYFAFGVLDQFARKYRVGRKKAKEPVLVAQPAVSPSEMAIEM